MWVSERRLHLLCPPAELRAGFELKDDCSGQPAADDSSCCRGLAVHDNGRMFKIASSLLGEFLKILTRAPTGSEG